MIESLQPFEQEDCDDHGTWYSIQIRPYLTSDQKITGVVITAHNIDAIKKAYNAKDLRLAAIIRDSNDAIIVHDLEGKILEWNRGATQLYGFEEQEALPMNFKSLVPDDEITKYNTYIQKVIGNNLIPSFESRRKRKDGKLIEVWLTTTVITDEFDNPVAIASTERDLGDRLDIERRKKLEMKLEFEKKAALESNRLKSEFLANVSHEIRTPLTAIIGFSEKIAYKSQRPDDLESVEIIRRNATHLQHLVNDILDLAKVESGKIEFEKRPISLINELAENYISLQRLATERNLGLEFVFDGRIPEKIYTDPIRFRQILLNIVGNALKFSEDGVVEVTFKLVNSSINGAHNKLQIFVKDTGRGISKDQAKKLFKPFSQIDSTITRNIGGTGLGLVLSRHLARALGGEVSLEHSILGVGSTFLIELDPGSLRRTKFIKGLKQNQLRITKSIGSIKLESDYLQGIEVLLAEDCEDIQTLTKLLLESKGALVDLASNGQIALEKSRDHRYDLVLMDIQMPILDGYKATALMRKEGYEGPIVALTARLMKSELKQALTAGCTDALGKPIDQEKLFKMVRSYKKKKQST